jgi:hypothetical protein
MTIRIPWINIGEHSFQLTVEQFRVSVSRVHTTRARDSLRGCCWLVEWLEVPNLQRALVCLCLKYLLRAEPLLLCAPVDRVVFGLVKPPNLRRDTTRRTSTSQTEQWANLYTRTTGTLLDFDWRMWHFVWVRCRQDVNRVLKLIGTFTLKRLPIVPLCCRRNAYK